MLRSVEAGSFMRRKELAGTVLPTRRDVLRDFYDISQALVDTDPRFLKKLPCFNDINDVVKTDVVTLRRRANFLLQ